MASINFFENWAAKLTNAGERIVGSDEVMGSIP
jgi:hypothetical protein